MDIEANLIIIKLIDLRDSFVYFDVWVSVPTWLFLGFHYLFCNNV